MRGDTSDRVAGMQWSEHDADDLAARAHHAQLLVDILRAERGRLVSLVETLRDGILLLDSGQRVAMVNPAFRHLAKATDRPLPLGPSADWETLLDELQPVLVDGPVVTSRLRDALAATGGTVGEEIAFEDGRIVELDILPVEQDGHRWGTLVQARDVTARVSAKRGLEKDNRDLAGASTMSSDFVAMVAHELRGPLSSVVAFALLLGEPDAGNLSVEQREFLDVIDRNANRLLRLIENLLLLSRLEARTLPLRYTPVHVADLLESVAAERRAAAREAGVSMVVEVADGPPLICDETRIHQLAANLLGNAVTFTPTGGSVVVRAHWVAAGAAGPATLAGTVADDEGWQIEITDTGVGIPAGELARIFTAFFRGTNDAATPGRPGSPGSGLGLAISRAIAELHGGTIQVASTDGAGTTVTVSLPTRPRTTDGG